MYQEYIAIENNEVYIESVMSMGQRLLPWLNIENSSLKNISEEKPNLDSFYLFPFSEITINNIEEDIPTFINERYQTILSVAHRTGITVATIYSSRDGRNTIYLGFKRASDTKDENDIELFQSIINGILPGKTISYNENVKFSTLVSKFKEGGIITGIPILKKEDKEVRFKISSVIRSLYNKEYTLAIISNPIPYEQQITYFNEIIHLKAKFHTIATQTIGKENGTGRTDGRNQQKSEGTTKTKGHSVGGTAGVGIPTPTGFIGVGVNYGHNWSEAKSENTATGTSRSDSINESKSLSYEQQNALAIELEKIAEQLRERMTKGFSTGLWETTITFSTNDKITSQIIGGSFVGELSKPNEHLLPPSNLYCETLPEGCHLFLPKVENEDNSIFPKKLASYITSEELSLISSPPTESLSGFEIKKMPTLAVNDTSYIDDGIKLGLITDYGNPIENSFLRLSTKDLNKHLFIAGLTGSGKSTTVKHILKSLWEIKDKGVPFLVLESAKRDYRQLLNDPIFKNNLNIFTVGSTISPIRFNPFYIQQGVDPLVHIDYLKAIFNASFSLYGPMPAIVEKCIHRIYLKKGWNLTKGSHPNFINEAGKYDSNNYNSDEHYYCFPTLTDLKNEVEDYVKNELAYKGELQDNIRTAIVVRLESLSVGAKGMMFDTYDFFPIEQLLNTNTILEMESLADDDDKAFFVGLMLILISQYRQRNNPAVNPGLRSKGLEHFLVIEEAHRLLKNVSTEKSSEMTGNSKGKAVELFANVISEMRSLGQGVAVVEQIPSKISPDVIKNSNTKIIHRLVSKDDQSLLAGSLSISDEDALYLNRLTTGHALCHKEGMERPVECAIINDIKSFAISDKKVYEVMGERLKNKPLHPFEVYELSQVLGKKGRELIVSFLNSLCTIPSSELKKLIKVFATKIKQHIAISVTHFEDEFISDYVTKHILTLLTHGIYQRKNKLPNGLKKAIYSVLETSEEKNLFILKGLLKEYWSLSTVEFISKVVTELSLKHILKNNNETNTSSIEIVSSYFLIENISIVTEISVLVSNKTKL